MDINVEYIRQTIIFTKSYSVSHSFLQVDQNKVAESSETQNNSCCSRPTRQHGGNVGDHLIVM